LILLVVSVLLAGIVTYYATNITMTRTEQEDVDIIKAHIWVNGTGSTGALMVQNLGGRDILIDKVTVRGVDCSWGSAVEYYRVQSGDDVSGDFALTYDGSDFDAKIGTVPGSWTDSEKDLPLASSGEMLLFLNSPDNIDLDDIGTTVSITVFTVNGQYIEEVNVESASGS